MPHPPSYWDYLKLDQLLDLQAGLDAREEDLLADELHFIVVHQVYELWFKLVLRSMRHARDHLAAPLVPEEKIPHVVHHLRRVNAVLKQAVDQFVIMETLTPQDFLGFRTKLVPSSGFQSFQMRELEVLMGLEDSQRVRLGDTDPLQHIRDHAHTGPAARLAWSRIEAVRQEQSLLSALNDWLYRTPIQGSRADDPGDEAVVNAFIDDYLGASQRSQEETLARLVGALGESERPRLSARIAATQATARAFLQAEDAPVERRAKVRRVRAALLFIESYRELPLLAWPRLLLDVVVEMEEQLLLWRNRHARMVERLIGRRVGTGGSDGVDYLDQTSRYRVFTDLWAVRTVLLPKDDLPPLRAAERYGFASP